MNNESKDLEEIIYEEKIEQKTCSTIDYESAKADMGFKKEIQGISKPLEADDSISTDISENTDSRPEKEPEIIPSMEEFETEINNSFKRIKEGDILRGTVIGISDTEVIVDLNYYTEGIIKLDELSNDPRFSIKADISIGEEISAAVIGENKEGNIILSRKRADDILAWDQLKELMNNRTICNIKVSQAVKGGVVTYLKGIRAFIPASQLGLDYVEDLETYTGRELEVIVITVDEDNKKLVLSAKEPAKAIALADKNSRISRLQKGFVTTGIVEKIMPFGAFVNIGEDLSGLVHVSQICGKRIKSPNEVIKEGEEVTVKIIDIKDGKISLSMKEVEEKDEVIEDAYDVPSSYSSGVEASTGLGDLLKNFKI